MSQEVKVTIEWNGNTVGLHEEPMTVHIAGKSDPNEIIGAVAKAMAMVKEPTKPKREEDKFFNLTSKGPDVFLTCPDGKEHFFPSYRQALEWLVDEYGNCKTAL